MRLELLLGLVKAPIVTSRKHVPGDIFSPRLYDGCLQTLDEDELLIFESTGLEEDLRIMARFESEFVLACSGNEALHDWIQTRLRALNGRAIATIMHASLLSITAGHKLRFPDWWFYMAQMFLLDSVQRWVHTLARRRRSDRFYNFVWKWIVRLVPGYNDSPRHERLKRTRVSIVKKLSQHLPICFQWTQLASDDITRRHEEILITALVSYGAHFVHLDSDHEVARVFERLEQVMEPWDVWIQMLSAKGRRHNRTALLVRMGSLFYPHRKEGAKPLPNPLGVRYRLACTMKTRNGNRSTKSAFSFDLDPSIALYDGPEYRARGHVHRLLRWPELEQRQIDDLIDAVRRCKVLDEEQKDCMVEGLRAFRPSFKWLWGRKDQ
jgi:hypothetical protein